MNMTISLGLLLYFTYYIYIYILGFYWLILLLIAGNNNAQLIDLVGNNVIKQTVPYKARF